MREGAASAGLSEASEGSVVDLLAGYEPTEEAREDATSPLPMGGGPEPSDENTAGQAPHKVVSPGSAETRKGQGCVRLPSFSPTQPAIPTLPQLKKQPSVIGEVDEADEWI